MLACFDFARLRFFFVSLIIVPGTVMCCLVCLWFMFLFLFLFCSRGSLFALLCLFVCRRIYICTCVASVFCCCVCLCCLCLLLCFFCVSVLLCLLSVVCAAVCLRCFCVRLLFLCLIVLILLGFVFFCELDNCSGCCYVLFGVFVVYVPFLVFVLFTRFAVCFVVPFLCRRIYRCTCVVSVVKIVSLFKCVLLGGCLSGAAFFFEGGVLIARSMKPILRII